MLSLLCGRIHLHYGAGIGSYGAIEIIRPRFSRGRMHVIGHDKKRSLTLADAIAVSLLGKIEAETGNFNII